MNPRHAARGSTPPASTQSSDADRSSKAELQAGYKEDMVEYQLDLPQYETQKAGLDELINWMTTSTSPHIIQSCLKSGKSLAEWYDNLQKMAPDAEMGQNFAQNVYNKALTKLRRHPSNWDDWLENWQGAFAYAQDVDLLEVQRPSYWLKALHACLQEVLPTSVPTIRRQLKLELGSIEKIEFHHVVSMLLTEINDLPPTKGRGIAKGSFGPTFDTKGTELPIPPAKERRAKELKAKDSSSSLKRPRADTVGKGCEVCGHASHVMANCYFVFPEKAFKRCRRPGGRGQEESEKRRKSEK